jgi:hypothetical protein
MAQLVFIVGVSGSGKSTSGRNLNPETTAIINSDQKALPFKKFNESYNVKKGNYYKTSNSNEVMNALKASHKNPLIKELLYDTWSRTMTDYVMSPEFRASKGFEKYGVFAAAQYDMLNIINEKMRDDMIVYVICHPDSVIDDMGTKTEKISVQGKMLEKFFPESFSSIVLYADIIKTQGEPNRHVFRTKTNGNNSCKTPMDMFETDVIDNDLTIVSKAIREYYGI